MRSDIENMIKENKVNTLFIKGTIKRIEKYINEDEKILYLNRANLNIYSSGENLEYKKIDFKNQNKLPVVFIITNKRVLTLYKMLLEEKVKQIPVEKISSYEVLQTSANVYTMLTLKVYSNSNTMEVDIPNKKDLNIKLQNILEEIKK